ncbi:MAG TPA: class I SAM-dependent methyltransferase, partial [Candidatus Udaeobacter sp.]|nr:class I SAM-dependent methyltransferase [Candidatus Udaeobacter sp.]
MIRIEIGRRNYLLYLLLPHHLKSRLLTPASRAKLDRINRAFNETIYSGAGASAYDQIHRYAEDEQHEYPARPLVAEVWPEGGYGHALEVGAGSGYFTTLIARHAERVIALEPVADMQEVLKARCRAEGVDNVEVLGVPAAELPAVLPAASVDTAFVIQSLHHLHDRDRVFEALGRIVRPGGRLLMVEPHHNLRRVARLFRKYLGEYHAPVWWSNERNWATHDFLTRGELRALCRIGGFEPPHLSSYWIPYSRRL